MRISDWSSDVCSSDLPGYRAPVAGTLNLGEAAVTPVSSVIPWPATLPEQVGAVQSILAAAPAPLGAGDIARNFKGKRAATVRPVLDALAGLRSEEHTSELQSLMRISYAVFCLKK